MDLEILCIKPIYPQYSGVLETCLALRYWFFEVLGSESVDVLNVVTLKNKGFTIVCYVEGFTNLTHKVPPIICSR